MIRHLLVTDIRRFRWILVPWVLLTVAYAALVFVTPGYVGDPRRYDHFNAAIVLLFLVTHLAPLVLVPLVVQADAPVGSDVFWATRPIRPRALLAAKTILLVLAMVILPSLLELAAMTAAQITPREIARVSLDTVLGAVVWLTLLMVASAVTPSYAKFALLCASTVVGMAINVIVMTALIRSQAEYAVGVLAVAPVPLPETPDTTGGVVFQLGVILAGCALLVVQYQRRQRTISVPVGVVGVAFAFLAATWWPWPLLRARSTLPEWTISAPRISAASAMAPFDPPPPVIADRGGALRLARMALRVGGVAPGWYATVSMRSAELTLPDGAVIRSRRGGFSASPAPEDINEAPQRVALRQVLGVARLADRYPPRGENVASMIVSADEYRRLESATVRYRGEFVVDLWHAEIAGTLPLISGGVFDGGVYQLRLLDTKPTSRGVLAFSALETRATSTFDRRPDETYTVFALNRARSEAIEALLYEGSEIGNIAGIAGFGVHATVGIGRGFLRRGVVVTLLPQQGSNRVDIPLDEEWLKNALLIVVRTTRAGHVVRSVEVPEMRVCTSPNGEC